MNRASAWSLRSSVTNEVLDVSPNYYRAGIPHRGRMRERELAIYAVALSRADDDGAQSHTRDGRRARARRHRPRADHRPPPAQRQTVLSVAVHSRDRVFARRGVRARYVDERT